MKRYKALTIAGSDTSGGAGIQADLKTFQELQVYGMNALTTIVAQNPFEGWAHEVFPQDPAIVAKQIDTVLKGIGVDAVKTGMLGSIEIINIVAEKVDQYGVDQLVVDPVMVCKGADEALNPETDACLRDVLVPKAFVVTPNLFEATQLSGVAISSLEDMKVAAKAIHELGAKHVVIKGGSKLESAQAVDVWYDGEEFHLLESDEINTTYTHGAGCTFAAAIAASLAKGKDVKEAIYTAKSFVTAAIKHGSRLNDYVGSVAHGAYNLEHK
ncbi:pyridoxine/pyridoxal/pyridoxamine kinase [Shouchella lehensis]|uniref:pyridoxal kinase n=1 Tax=Shouchella lehensis G1 TaxID=1246626 RepID=A0A060M1M1_9BACI|nr:pyridoxine/pyridoxal/pyridoxamine kinase [Shouchella lehensis]AIC96337.1 Pyridoxine kinase [Shouchella lehensis G1]RQW18934.1 bifunctional hydroxymethylpyrimidine kinase/phosphomethylpyrimidine kinase [Bacillus sp. C1-1]